MSFRQSYTDMVYKDYLLTIDRQKINLDYVYNLLCTPSRYSSGLPPERFSLVIKNSICFNILQQGQQIGFARVISDYTEFASLWDVFIDEPHRGKGLGKTLIKYILEHPYLKGIFRWFLMTEDAHGLYQKFGFKTEVYNPYTMMKVNTDT